MFLVCFRFLFCLGCSFVIVGDTYVVHCLGGSCWFVGSRVAGSVCLAGVYALGHWGCSSASSCFLTSLVLAGFFSLILPCRVGVQRRWFDPDLCRNTMKYRNTHKRRDAAEIRLYFIDNK
jgi:hypothetical protein